LVKDKSSVEHLIEIAYELLSNQEKCNELSENISFLGKPNATSDIVNELEKIV